MDLIKWIILLLGAIIIFLIPSWMIQMDNVGKLKEKNNELHQVIQQRAIVASWIFILGIFVMSAIPDLFGFTKKLFHKIQSVFDSLSLVYLIILVVSYFVYYWIFSKKFSMSHKASEL